MSMLGPILAWGPKGGSSAWAVRLPLPAPLPPPPQPSTDPLPAEGSDVPRGGGRGYVGVKDSQTRLCCRLEMDKGSTLCF